MKPYRPSNGFEGERFKDRFCYKCANYEGKDGLDYCEIEFLTMAYDTKDPEYPKEWIWKENKPTCTAFVSEYDNERHDQRQLF